MPEENQYDKFFTDHEINQLPGNNDEIKRRIQQYGKNKPESITEIPGFKKELSDMLLTSHLPIEEIILAFLKEELEKIPEVNLSDRNESVSKHMRRADLEDYIRKLEEHINLEKTGKNVQAPYAHEFDEGKINLLDVNIKMLSDQSPLSALQCLLELEREINTLTDPNSDIFKQLYYQLSTHKTLTASEYNNTYDYSVLYEEHIRTDSGSDFTSKLRKNLKITETALAQTRINIVSLFIKQDNESANHEFVMNHMQEILIRIQTKRVELIEKLEKTILQKLSTEDEGIKSFNKIDNPNDVENFYVIETECQTLENCAHKVGLTHLKLLNDKGGFLHGKDHILDNYKHVYNEIAKEIDVQTKAFIRSFLQEGENIYRRNQK